MCLSISEEQVLEILFIPPTWLVRAKSIVLPGLPADVVSKEFQIIEFAGEAFAEHKICHDQVSQPVLVLQATHFDRITMNDAAAEIIKFVRPPSWERVCPILTD